MMPRKTNILVTGGAGFIGSALCRRLVGSGKYNVLNLDKLTYAGTSGSLQEIADAPDYSFVKGDICDRALIRELLATFRPDRIMHLAAESHVDRSIDNAGSFVSTNVIGTFQLLEAAVDYWKGLAPSARDDFRFHHVSTDEVYGDLASGTESVFTEHSPYRPSSPYAASKAASDHLVRAWARTYGLPVVVSNCCNNYGSFQFPEKLVPLVILNALNERPLPVYGDGSHVRDWIYVDDHVAGLETIAMHGLPGETYNVGSSAARTNLEVIGLICSILDEKHPRSGGRSYRDLIEFVADRPGHDRHYAVDASKIVEQLGWTPLETFETGIAKTVDWYIGNAWWWAPLREACYGGERLGATPAQ